MGEELARKDETPKGAEKTLYYQRKDETSICAFTHTERNKTLQKGDENTKQKKITCWLKQVNQQVTQQVIPEKAVGVGNHSKNYFFTKKTL